MPLEFSINRFTVFNHNGDAIKNGAQQAAMGRHADWRASPTLRD